MKHFAGFQSQPRRYRLATAETCAVPGPRGVPFLPMCPHFCRDRWGRSAFSILQYSCGTARGPQQARFWLVGVEAPSAVCLRGVRLLAISYPLPAFFRHLLQTQALKPFRPLGHPTFSTGSPRDFHWVTQGFDWVTQGSREIKTPKKPNAADGKSRCG